MRRMRRLWLQQQLRRLRLLILQSANYRLTRTRKGSCGNPTAPFSQASFRLCLSRQENAPVSVETAPGLMKAARHTAGLSRRRRFLRKAADSCLTNKIYSFVSFLDWYSSSACASWSGHDVFLRPQRIPRSRPITSSTFMPCTRAPIP